MKASIIERARALGFDACSITTAAAPASAAQFESWLARGEHAEMAWLARTAPKRIDPQRVLLGAQSIIVVAASYGDPSSHSPPSPASRGPLAEPGATGSSGTGVVARYARYADYHELLGSRLAELAEHVRQLGGEETKALWYVDTGPFLERDLAQRAGLGFVGKHTNLIGRRLGNWLLLGVIVTTLRLESDLPERNHCGHCVRCLEACPTQAIRAPFQLDARRCISYLTIELKGSIPVELRPAIGARIFGCDDCLAVCPWNRFAREGRLMQPHGRRDLAAPDLVELLALDETGFKRRFAGTPILRAKRRGLLRNVCVALGNVGDAAVLPALERAARDPEPLIAEHARWAQERIRLRSNRSLADETS